MSLVSCRRTVVAATGAALLTLSAAAFAQGLELPAPSLRARVEQRVGLTDFKLDYSSPAVKGRKIWGDLVPYDKIWRTGANAATKLEASKDFTVGDKTLKAGAYSLFTIPGKASWTVIFNSNPTTSPQEPDAKTEVARFTVKPAAMPASRERLTFIFSDTNDDGTNLDLEWEKVRVRIPIKVATKTQVATSIEEATGNAWRPHFASARYLADNGGDLTQATGFIDKSIAIRATWWNHWVKAQILAKQGKKAEALAAAEQAQSLGKGDEAYEDFGKEEVGKTIAGLKK